MSSRGRILNLRVDRVRLPDGRSAKREVVEHRPAVVILAENDASEVLLVNQFRYPANRVLIELPAGIVEEGEDPEEAAIRELQEETGWKPRSVRRVGSFFSSPGFCSEMLTLFHATGLVEERRPADDDEFIVAGFASQSEIERLLASGDATDGKTLFALYWWLYGKTSKKIV
jgi:ADP-ribose pyrophosphatase